MKTLKIKHDDVKTVYATASKSEKKLLESLFGKEVFKEPVDIMSKIKNFEAVLADQNIDKVKFDKECKGLSEDEIAYKMLKLICNTLNERWTPDWDDSSEYKYYPWFKMGSSGFRSDGYDTWDTGTNVGSRLCFKTSELAEYAGTQFTDIYKQFMVI